MPPKATTAESTRPLDANERKQLEDLLARASTGAMDAPATRFGTPYIALVNLSVPRRGGDGTQNDLVRAGETVNFTDDEAARYLRHGPQDGRQIAVIRPAAGPGSSAEVPRVPPRAVSGRLQAPPPPAPGTDGARPDPPGSSQIQYAEPASVPETAEPQPGSENWMGPDAQDIPPRARAGR